MRMGVREIFWGGAGGQTDLPYDAEVEFLQSSGTQYIDTGVPAGTSEFTITATLSFPSEAIDSSHNNLIIGAGRTDYSGTGVYIGTHEGKWTTLEPGVAFHDGSQVTTKTTVLKWRMTGAGVSTMSSLPGDFSTITVNSSTRFGPSAQWRSQNFMLFSFSYKSLGPTDFNKVKIYKLQIEKDGVLVRDYVPVRKGNVGALYDRRGVGGMDPDGSPRNDGMYYNVGMGAFQYGQDVVPVEYIEGTGTQWIDTGVVPNTNTKVQLKVMNLESTGNVILGYFTTSDQQDWRLFNINQIFVFDQYSQRISGSNFASNVWRELETGNYYVKDLSTGAIQISGNTATFTGVSTITLNYCSFNNTKSKNRWGYVKIYDDAAPVRDMVAVRVGSEGAMMDTLTRIVYRNRGSGAFVVGADVTPHGRLPDGYTEVQWLSTQAYGTSSSGGGAYTTVPVPQTIAQSQVKVEAHAVDTDTTGTIGAWNILVDTLTGDNTPSYGMNIRKHGNDYTMCAVPGYDSYYISYTRGVPMCVVWDRGTFSVEQNGAVSSRSVTAKTQASSNALNIGGTAWGVPGSRYGARYWPGLIGEITVSVSGQDIIHLVPCRNLSGVYGFYDLVGNGFYSSLTATPFAKGSVS